MKAKFKIIVFGTLFIFLASSCQDFFQVNDKELITENLIVSNKEYVTGLWDNLYHSFDNGFQEVGNAMLADACDEADNNVPYAGVSLFNQGSWNSYNNPYNRGWAFMYQGINNASYFLKISDTTINKKMVFYKEYKYYPDNMATYNNFIANLKAYRIDAKFFKAYFNFLAWRTYGNVPIVDGVLTVDEAKNLKQATTAEMVSYLSTTLNGVIAEFGELEKTTGSAYIAGKWNSNNLGRITKGAALALKCRMFLYAASPLYNEGVYNTALCDSAAKTAAAIINSNIYSVDITYRKLQFNRTISNPENILDNRVDILDNNYMETWNYPKSGLAKYVNVSSVCSNATCPSQNLVDAYDNLPGYSAANPFAKKDFRFSQTITCDGDIVNGKPVESFMGGKDGIGDKNSTTTGYYLKKFVQDTITLPVGTATPHVWYIFRYSEVLLNYAEAMFNAYGNVRKGYLTGTDLNALEALNIVRLRNGKNTGNVALTGTLTNDIIRKERQVELAFEGHRFWDVRRWLIANTTENLSLRGMKITKADNGIKTYNPNFQVETRKFVAGMELFPIPYTEMHLYPSWKQNWW